MQGGDVCWPCKISVSLAHPRVASSPRCCSVVLPKRHVLASSPRTSKFFVLWLIHQHHLSPHFVSSGWLTAALLGVFEASGLLSPGEFSYTYSRRDLLGQIFGWELREVGIRTQIPLNSLQDGWHLQPETTPVQDVCFHSLHLNHDLTETVQVLNLG